jgi:uncharacterized membrane protein
MTGALLDLASDIARWLHVLAAIAWMGFGLWLRRLARRAQPTLDDQAELEVWDVHSLGFWRTQKIAQPTVAQLENMVWSFSQIRWLFATGLVLFGLVYYRQPGLYLVDPNVHALSPRAAIAWSLLGLTCAPLINEVINLIPLRYKLAYGIACMGHIFGWIELYARLYAQHGAMIQIGAMLGVTICLNVIGYLYPATRAAARALASGERPDPETKLFWDRRNKHGYVLPGVVFLMLSGHMGTWLHANGHSVLTIVAILLFSAIARWILEEVHGHCGVMPNRLRWVSALVIVTAGAGAGWLAWANAPGSARPGARPNDFPSTAQALQAQTIVRHRCSTCHATQPSFPGIGSPPRGIVLTSTTLPYYADRIAAMVGSQRMPPGNVTGMLPDERSALLQWAKSHAR